MVINEVALPSNVLKRNRESRDDDSDDGTATTRLSPISRSVSSVSLSSTDERSSAAEKVHAFKRPRPSALQEPAEKPKADAVQSEAELTRSVTTTSCELASLRGSLKGDSSKILVSSESSWATRLLTYSYTTGMAKAGVNIVVTRSDLQAVRHGISLVSRAAAMGSDYAAYYLALWHHEGSHGLPHDPAEAKFWYEKVASGACACKHLAPEYVAKAKSHTEEIEMEISALAAAENAAAAVVEEELATL
mmetsp:Transcript_2321/g.7447  ORF Transcript_2321/g.7447 Transcript_2321/m.7447 type:complete len:248 (-) Transcript_2321:624-1367(-)|eukprot:scaffold126678_cov31-Tisochrysis_lutea.AAC.1